MVGSERGEKTLVFNRGEAASENLTRNDSGTIARWLALPSAVEEPVHTHGIIRLFEDDIAPSEAGRAVAAAGHRRSRISKRAGGGMPSPARARIATGARLLDFGGRWPGRARFERRRRARLLETSVDPRVRLSEPGLDGRWSSSSSRSRLLGWRAHTPDQREDERRLRRARAHRAFRPLSAPRLGSRPFAHPGKATHVERQHFANPSRHRP